MTVHHPKGRTLILTVFWYNRCGDLYSLLTNFAVQVPAHTFYTNWRSCGASYSRCRMVTMRIAVKLTKQSILTQTEFWVWLRSPYECHSLCTKTGQWHGTSYRSGTIPIMRMAIHHPERTTVMQTAFWYNSCRDLYSLLTYVVLRVPARPL